MNEPQSKEKQSKMNKITYVLAYLLSTNLAN